MESVFAVLSERHRLAIVSLLLEDAHSVGEIEQRLRLPQPTVSKHLRVLREAGFVEATTDAQRRVYRLRPEPLQSLDAWLEPFRRFWAPHLDALERHLDRQLDQDVTTGAVPVRREPRATSSTPRKGSSR
jgi:DNA-binding transcriptional ArsR family regulator